MKKATLTFLTIFILLQANLLPAVQASLLRKSPAPSSTEQLLAELKKVAVTNVGLDKLSPAMIEYHQYLQKMDSALTQRLEQGGDNALKSSAELDTAVNTLIDSVKTFNTDAAAQVKQQTKQQNKNLSEKQQLAAEKKQQAADDKMTASLTDKVTNIAEELEKAIPDAATTLPPVPHLLQPASATGSRTIDEVLKHNKTAVQSQLDAALKAIAKDKSPAANARRILLKSLAANVATLNKTIQAGNEGRASAYLQEMEKAITTINARPLDADMSDMTALAAKFKDYAGKLTSKDGANGVTMIAGLNELKAANVKVSHDPSVTAKEPGTQTRPEQSHRPQAVNGTAGENGHTFNLPGVDAHTFTEGDNGAPPNHTFHSPHSYHPPVFSEPDRPEERGA